MSALPRSMFFSFVAAAVSLVVLVISPGWADENPPSPEMIDFLLRDGEESLAHERFAEAADRFNEVLRVDWNHARAFELLQQVRSEREQAIRRWEYHARVAESQREWTKAQGLYQRIIDEDTTRSDLRDRLARLDGRVQLEVYIRSGMDKFIADDFAGAELEFTQALAIDSTDSLAAAYLDRTRQKIAASGSLTTIQSDSDSWTKYLDALRRFREGDLVAAERLWRELLIRYPGNESILSNLEQVRRRLGHEKVAADE